MSLTSEDMTFVPNSLYVGSAYAIIHGSHIQSCTFSCKMENSLCDIFSVMGSTLWSSPIPLNTIDTDESRKKLIHNAMRPVIGIDSAAVKCSRCNTYLGDASLLSGPVFDEDYDMDSDDDGDILGSYTFKKEDIDSVKVFWNRITLRQIDDCEVEPCDDPVSSTSTEQVPIYIAR